MLPTLKAGFLAAAASFLFLFPLSTGTTPCGISNTESIIIRDQDGNTANILRETGFRNTFYLECIIMGTSTRDVPDPWYRMNGEVVTNKSTVFVSGNQLRFSPFRVSDQGLYQCYCTNTQGQLKLSNDITIYGERDYIPGESVADY